MIKLSIYMFLTVELKASMSVKNLQRLLKSLDHVRNGVDLIK